jgi:hypothetical protein
VSEHSTMVGRMIALRSINRDSSESSDDQELPRRKRACGGETLVPVGGCGPRSVVGPCTLRDLRGKIVAVESEKQCGSDKVWW